MKKLILLGGGGHALSVLDAALSSCEYGKIVLLDKKENIGKKLLGCDIVGTDKDLEQLYTNGYHYGFVSVGSIENTEIRRGLFNSLKLLNFEIPNIIDSTAVIARGVQLGQGIFVGKQAILNSGTNIEDMVIINSAAIIEHGCIIEEFSHISVGSILCGNVTIKKDTFIGANATVVQNVRVSEKCIVGAGSLILKNIPPKSKVIGNGVVLKNESIHYS